LPENNDMRLFIVVIFLMSVAACNSRQAPEPQSVAPKAVTLVSDSAEWSATDRQLNPLVNAYFDLKDALVEWDTMASDAAAKKLKASGETLVSDSGIALDIRQHISSISAEAEGFLGETDITEKRRAFSMMGQHLLPLLKAVSFRAQPVYQQVCPMAFNDNETAYWLSNQREIMNPYLGKKHPKYASGMLHCGELSDSLFIRP
jgi:hypothetical protein